MSRGSWRFDIARWYVAARGTPAARHPENRGKAASLWTGMQAALKRDWVPKLNVYPRACKIG